MLSFPGCGGETASGDATTASPVAVSLPPAPAPGPPSGRARRSPTADELAHFKEVVERGVNFLNGGEFGKAAGELSVAVALQPENAVVLRYLGSAYVRDNQLESARRVLQAAINLAPTDPAAHYELAQVALAAGDLDGAAAESRRTVELDPGNRRAQELVGIVQFRQGELEQAVATLEPLVVDGGRRIDSSYTLGLCYQDLERHEESRDVLRKVVQRNPLYVQAWFSLGQVLAGLGDERGAAEANEKFLSLGGKVPIAQAEDDEDPAEKSAPPAPE